VCTAKIPELSCPGAMETLHELEHEGIADCQSDVCIQSGGYFLELSLDWIVLRASENIHRLLSESHVTLIDEPLGRFVHSQALHDLRNLFSRLSGTTGIGRAYGIRLTDDPDLFDIAFQLRDGRFLLDAVPSLGQFGEAFGSVGGLIAGLSSSHGQALLDGGGRRMRAMTGYDRVTLVCGDRRTESSRGPFKLPANMSIDLPVFVADTEALPIGIFPRIAEETSAEGSLFRAPDPSSLEKLRSEGVRSSLRVPFQVDDMRGEFRCDCRTPRESSFELHAAAELFAQLFAMRLEIDHLKSR
jgi:light-regulated signal transduction histidine kinase (bacteriophytochrome)